MPIVKVTESSKTHWPMSGALLSYPYHTFMVTDRTDSDGRPLVVRLEDGHAMYMTENWRIDLRLVESVTLTP